MSLKSKTSKAALWGLVERVSQQGLQMLVSILLARQLLPTEIGMIAMLWIFLSVAAIFSDGGLSTTLIQKQDATELDKCSAFYFNITVSVMGVAILWVMAPYVAQFYDVPALKGILRAVSFSFLFTSFGFIHTVTLNKNLDLRTQAKTVLIAGVCSGSVAVAMAYSGCGVWSLVGQILTQDMARTLALWYYSPWRPKLIFSWASLQTMLPFASKVFGSAFLSVIFANLYPSVIGKLFSPVYLGYISLAGRLPQTFSGSLTTIVSRVSTPVYPTLREQPEAFKKALRKAVTMMTIVNSPVLVGLALVAHPLVTCLLTPKWLPAVTYLQIYCVLMLLSPFQNGYLEAILGMGKAGLQLKVEMFQKVLSVANVFVSYRWGVMGLLLGELVVSTLGCIIKAYSVRQLIGYSFGEQFRDLLPSLLICLGMGLLVFLAQSWHWPSPLGDLVFQVAVGVISFLGLCWIFRVKAFHDLLDVGKHMLKR